MNETIKLLQSLLSQASQLADQFTQEEMQEILGIFGRAVQVLHRNSTTTAAPVPANANLLWILSGGQPEAFTDYLRSFPDPALNALIRNPTQLTQVISRLHQEMPQGQPAKADSIEHAPLQSSNIWGFSYNPKNGDLFVRFNNGSVYGYEGVPPFVYKIFQSGAIPAKTNGKNNFGRWWIGKIPSLGASFYELIRNGGYAYQKLK